ncbi:hypothetical protein TREMEDRAFT_62558 [Tremella mesenterica DSM 1558]|uniref:uncharacterized protein n=1 Tax=Tremella mesenterica (strain ATCC 24925 / CBS 8224 / DSM 1558 / NBRC 9311 / NRRL Y-6157 / RJB 2259-6 / UBC 559-6) TaxID=578456 RepID=UPI0003F498D6|nr:uncharacterized protein TREMEDRAFT_62558 [Tremella mesenterica DSM 1558]EIW69689.1 hypothetical protein TREMEDRAFT_62558 [Tremella mesenterica DSM 1558]
MTVTTSAMSENVSTDKIGAPPEASRAHVLCSTCSCMEYRVEVRSSWLDEATDDVEEVGLVVTGTDEEAVGCDRDDDGDEEVLTEADVTKVEEAEEVVEPLEEVVVLATEEREIEVMEEKVGEEDDDEVVMEIEAEEEGEVVVISVPEVMLLPDVDTGEMRLPDDAAEDAIRFVVESTEGTSVEGTELEVVKAIVEKMIGLVVVDAEADKLWLDMVELNVVRLGAETVETRLPSGIVDVKAVVSSESDGTDEVDKVDKVGEEEEMKASVEVVDGVVEGEVSGGSSRKVDVVRELIEGRADEVSVVLVVRKAVFGTHQGTHWVVEEEVEEMVKDAVRVNVVNEETKGSLNLSYPSRNSRLRYSPSALRRRCQAGDSVRGD